MKTTSINLGTPAAGNFSKGDYLRITTTHTSEIVRVIDIPQTTVITVRPISRRERIEAWLWEWIVGPIRSVGRWMRR